MLTIVADDKSSLGQRTVKDERARHRETVLDSFMLKQGYLSSFCFVPVARCLQSLLWWEQAAMKATLSDSELVFAWNHSLLMSTEVNWCRLWTTPTVKNAISDVPHIHSTSSLRTALRTARCWLDVAAGHRFQRKTFITGISKGFIVPVICA